MSEGFVLALVFVALIALFTVLFPRRSNAPARVVFQFGSVTGKERIMAVLNLTADQVDALADKQIPFSIKVTDAKGRPAKIDTVESSWSFADDGAGGSATFADDKLSGFIQLPVDASGTAVVTQGFVAGVIDADLDSGEQKHLDVRGDYAVTTEGAVVELTFGTPH